MLCLLRNLAALGALILSGTATAQTPQSGAPAGGQAVTSPRDESLLVPNGAARRESWPEIARPLSKGQHPAPQPHHVENGLPNLWTRGVEAVDRIGEDALCRVL